MFEAAAVGDTQKPSTNDPLVFPPVLMVTPVGKKAGVMVTVVPTKASEVRVTVWLPETPL